MGNDENIKEGDVIDQNKILHQRCDQYNNILTDIIHDNKNIAQTEVFYLDINNLTDIPVVIGHVRLKLFKTINTFKKLENFTIARPKGSNVVTNIPLIESYIENCLRSIIGMTKESKLKTRYVGISLTLGFDFKDLGNKKVITLRSVCNLYHLNYDDSVTLEDLYSVDAKKTKISISPITALSNLIY